VRGAYIGEFKVGCTYHYIEVWGGLSQGGATNQGGRKRRKKGEESGGKSRVSNPSLHKLCTDGWVLRYADSYS